MTACAHAARRRHVALAAIVVVVLAAISPSHAFAQPVVPPLAGAAKAMAMPAPGDPPAVAPEYRLRPGDLLQVKLFYSPELNEELPIRPDGRISLELVGDIVAAERTTMELAALLVEKYSAVLRDPQVVVIVKQIAERRIYVAGEVNMPGVLTLVGETSVLQSIVQAGGQKRSAELGTVVILRYEGKPEPRFFTVDLEATLRGKGPDITLQAYDIVFVPKTRVAKVNDFMAQYVRDIMPVPLTLGISYIFGGVLR